MRYHKGGLCIVDTCKAIHDQMISPGWILYTWYSLENDYEYVQFEYYIICVLIYYDKAFLIYPHTVNFINH